MLRAHRAPVSARSSIPISRSLLSIPGMHILRKAGAGWFKLAAMPWLSRPTNRVSLLRRKKTPITLLEEA